MHVPPNDCSDKIDCINFKSFQQFSPNHFFKTANSVNFPETLWPYEHPYEPTTKKARLNLEIGILIPHTT